MNTARQALIAILSIATLAGSIAPAQAAPQQTEASTLPTITIVGKRPSHPEFLQTVTIVAKRLTPQEKLAMAQEEGCLPTITIVGKRLNREQKSVLAQQEASRKKAVI
ncbi:hypothetical protein [Collimonas sp. OK412]|jgi:hypothetical protein|uniref:hypothetical protein n=1 Tax=Collimonas sp. (strain OK412) TaxID=1801619 RepID=UPI0008F305A7|nr:hypothetical protein [Collimonas sp. OK412]SFD31898.1 hypothetical protein SAMN04515619_13921 [Collimonas sp. OK412]